MKSSIPVNCPWGSARSSRVAPIHYWLPIGSPVSSLHVRAPLSRSHAGPQQRVQHAVWWAAIPVNRRGASKLQSWVPRSLSASTYGPVLSFPTFTYWAQCCCCRWWRGRPSWWASQSSACCRPPPRSSPRSPWQSHSLPTSSLTCQVPPHVIMLCTQAVGMKSLQAAERPADLAPVRFNCWWSSEMSHH